MSSNIRPTTTNQTTGPAQKLSTKERETARFSKPFGPSKSSSLAENLASRTEGYRQIETKVKVAEEKLVNCAEDAFRDGAKIFVVQDSLVNIPESRALMLLGELATKLAKEDTPIKGLMLDWDAAGEINRRYDLSDISKEPEEIR